MWETLLDGGEIMFLNDFEYNTVAKVWMGWSYFKRFLEGGSIPLGVPKTRGGNVEFKGKLLAFMTAPQEVALHSGKRLDRSETSQMDSRIQYIRLQHAIPEDQRREDPPCGLCGAKVYMEGKPHDPMAWASPGSVPALIPSGASSSSSSGSGRKRSASEIVHELAQLQQLRDNGVTNDREFKKLRDNVKADI